MESKSDKSAFQKYVDDQLDLMMKDYMKKDPKGDFDSFISMTDEQAK